MPPLTHTDLYSIYIRGDAVLAPSEPITSEEEACAYLFHTLDDAHAESVTVLRATESGVSDWTEDLVRKMQRDGWYFTRLDAPACFHDYIEDPADDALRAGDEYNAENRGWAAE